MPRKWRVEAIITMPRFVPKSPDGKFPPTLNVLNVFPEQCLLVHDAVEVWLRCKGPFTKIANTISYNRLEMSGEIEASYREPLKCPYRLQSEVEADTGLEAIDKLIKLMELATDFLTFQLQYPVKMVHLESYSPSPTVSGQFDIVTTSGTPYYKVLKDAVAIFEEPAYVTFDASHIRHEIPDDVAGALRWFGKGVAATSILDKFAFYWIAFETLATRWPDIEDAKRYLQCPRCQEIIGTCPLCGKSTDTGLLVGDKVRRVGKFLGRDDQLIRDLYETRHLVHGTLPLKEQKELETLPERTRQLKAIVIDAIKARLGIRSVEPPFASTKGFIAWSTMWLRGTTKELTW